MVDYKKYISYLRYEFLTIPWITVNDCRYSLSQCTLINIGVSLSPLLVQPTIETYILDNQNLVISTIECIKIFEQFGLTKQYNQLPKELLYKILLILPDRDINGVISHALYKSMMDANLTELDCDERQEYFNNGKAFTNHGYQSINDVLYADDRSVCGKLLTHFNLIDIQKRLNAEKVAYYFNVKKLRISKPLQIQFRESSINSLLWQKCKNDIFPYAYCYRIGLQSENEDARHLKESKILFCTQVEFEYDSEKFELDEFEIVTNDKKTFYIKIPNECINLNRLFTIRKMQEAIATFLCTIFDATDRAEKYKYLCSFDSNSDRDIQVVEDLDDYQIVAKAKNNLDITLDNMEDFISTLSCLSPSQTTVIVDAAQKIDFKNIDCMQNCEIIIKLFRNCKIDISDFNKTAKNMSFTLTAYYKNKIAELINSNEEKFKYSL